MSNDMSSIQILLRNMERKQINSAIDEQYAKLSKEMAFEAKNSVKKKVKTKTNGGTDLDHRKNEDDNKHNMIERWQVLIKKQEEKTIIKDPRRKK